MTTATDRRSKTASGGRKYRPNASDADANAAADAKAAAAIAADPRFAHLASDPRFSRFPHAARTVEIDERFAGECDFFIIK